MFNTVHDRPGVDWDSGSAASPHQILVAERIGCESGAMGRREH